MWVCFPSFPKKPGLVPEYMAGFFVAHLMGFNDRQQPSKTKLDQVDPMDPPDPPDLVVS